MDGKNLRPRHKAQSPSGVAESSLSLNLSSVLEDKKSLFGNCHSPNIDEVVLVD